MIIKSNYFPMYDCRLNHLIFNFIIYFFFFFQLQFVIYIVYMATLIAAKCKLSQALSFYVIVQGIIFFMLFLNFYIKTYKNSKSKLNHSEQNGISLEIKKST